MVAIRILLEGRGIVVPGIDGKRNEFYIVGKLVLQFGHVGGHRRAKRGTGREDEIRHPWMAEELDVGGRLGVLIDQAEGRSAVHPGGGASEDRPTP